MKRSTSLASPAPSQRRWTYGGCHGWRIIGSSSKPSMSTPSSSLAVKSIGPTIRSRPRSRSHPAAASSSAAMTSGSSSTSRKPNIPQRLPW